MNIEGNLLKNRKRGGFAQGGISQLAGEKEKERVGFGEKKRGQCLGQGEGLVVRGETGFLSLPCKLEAFLILGSETRLQGLTVEKEEKRPSLGGGDEVF